MKTLFLKLMIHLRNILASSVSHPHKKKVFEERGEKRTINHHLENFHHVFSSWLLASLVGVYSFLGTSFILEGYAAPSSPLPPQVMNLRGVVRTGAVILAWNPVPDSSTSPKVIDYVIGYKLSKSNSYKIFRDGVGTRAYAKVGSLKAGNTYDFRVAAKNKIGIGAYSQPIRITLTKNTKPINTPPLPASGTPGSTGALSGGEAPTSPPSIEAPVNGVCGTSSGKLLTSAPTELCTTGTPGALTSATFSYAWTCQGAHSGTTTTCSAYIQSNYTYYWTLGDYGACSLACGEGTQTRSVTCLRSDGATVADSNCTATKPPTSQSCNIEACNTPISGACGPYNGQTLSTTPSLTPTTNFCTTGIVSAVGSGDSSYTWTCAGTNGGTTASCSASK